MVVSPPASRTVNAETDLDKVSKGYAVEEKKTSSCIFVYGDMFDLKYLCVHEDR